MNLDIEGGKYTFVQRENGACEFYRHGEQWMDIGPGTKAIIAMACELESLREERDEGSAGRVADLERRLSSAKDRIADMLRGDDGQAWKEAEKFMAGEGRMRP